MVRSRSLSPAAYHAIPQAPNALNIINTTLPLSLDEVPAYDEPSDEPVRLASVTTMDAQIRWIHFVLGCAVLLPWNGAVHS